MKANEEISVLVQTSQWDGVRYASLTRLRSNQFDIQAWIYLGQAMVGLGRGKMGELCFRRAQILDPFIKGIEQALHQSRSINLGNDDKEVLKLLELPHVTVSACILTRNSSRTIGTCIEALKGAVDEIIVVDTGSSDNTVTIVESHGLTVHSYEWEDDFSSARNYAQSLVSSDWVLMVDSDEILLEKDKSFVRETAAVYNSAPNLIGIRATILNTVQGKVLPTRMLRMFPADPRLRWQGRIHESLDPAVPLIARPGLIEFEHDGYDGTKVGLEEKWRRNVHLLRLAVVEEPSKVSHFYYLGRELMFLNQLDEAEENFRKAIELMQQRPTRPGFAGRVFSDYINFLVFKRRNHDLAVELATQMTRVLPDHPDGWGWLAYIQRSSDMGTQYAARLRNNRGQYRYHFDLFYNLKSMMPQVFGGSTTSA